MAAPALVACMQDAPVVVKMVAVSDVEIGANRDAEIAACAIVYCA